MTKRGALQQLIHETLDDGLGQCTAFSMIVHILFQIRIAILEHENQLGFAVDDIVQSKDVGVLEFFEQRDLADGGGRCSFFTIEVDLFECDDIAGRFDATLGRAAWVPPREDSIERCTG